MNTVRRLLVPDGLFLLHTIGANKTMRSVDPWINKYIFTTGILPSIARIGEAVAGRFVMEDWHNLGANYDKTLMAWARNFTQGRAVGAFHCSDKVARMFQYYLLSCAGAFRARDLQVWQIVLSPRGLQGGYERPPLLAINE
jgi:cyclopropane-fatty-acyl-phospholipid synthase